MIFIVEDDGVIQNDIENLLKEEGKSTKCAYSYLSAIGLWNRYKSQIECIILDLNINPNGIEPQINSELFPVNALSFLKKIEWPNNTDIPVIVYSGYTAHLQSKCEEYNIPYNKLIVIRKNGDNFRILIKTVCESIHQ